MTEASGETETPKPEFKPKRTILPPQDADQVRRTLKRDEEVETDERWANMPRQEQNRIIEVTRDQRRTKRIKTEE